MAVLIVRSAANRGGKDGFLSFWFLVKKNKNLERSNFLVFMNISFSHRPKFCRELANEADF